MAISLQELQKQGNIKIISGSDLRKMGNVKVVNQPLSPNPYQPTTEDHASLIFGQPSTDPSIGENVVRGITNIFGKIGQAGENITKGALNYIGGAITALPAAISPEIISKEGTVRNPLTGEQVSPWFGGGQAGREAVSGKITIPSAVRQTAGESLQRGAEIAPFLMGSGEAKAATEAAKIATTAPKLSKIASISKIAKAAAPISTSFGVSKTTEELGKQLKTGEYNIPEAVGKGLETTATTFATDMAIRSIGSYLYNRGISKGIDKAAPEEKKIQQAINNYSKVINPTKNEINKIEIKGDKDINDAYRLMGENGIIINQTPDKRLDTVNSVEQMRSAVEEPNKKLNDLLSANPKNFNLDSLAEQAKSNINKSKYVNFFEKSGLKDEIDYITGLLKQETGSSEINSLAANETKKFAWGLSRFDSAAQQRPNLVNAARQYGFTIKDAIEKSYPEGVVRSLNEEIVRYLTAIKLLENAHGRVVRGGVMGNAFAKLTGAVIGQSIKVPVIGPYIGEKVAGKVQEMATSPERLTGAAAKILKK